jgi:hypothetical protein
MNLIDDAAGRQPTREDFVSKIGMGGCRRIGRGQ